MCVWVRPRAISIYVLNWKNRAIIKFTNFESARLRLKRLSTNSTYDKIILKLKFCGETEGGQQVQNENFSQM